MLDGQVVGGAEGGGGALLDEQADGGFEPLERGVAQDEVELQPAQVGESAQFLDGLAPVAGEQLAEPGDRVALGLAQRGAGALADHDHVPGQLFVVGRQLKRSLSVLERVGPPSGGSECER